MNRNNALFSSTEWFSVRETRKKATFDEISALDANRILNTSVENSLQILRGQERNRGTGFGPVAGGY